MPKAKASRTKHSKVKPSPFQRAKERILNNKFIIFCLSLGGLLNLTNFDLQKVQPSIDTSYMYVSSTLFTRDFFSDNVALTYGPLGFLVHAVDISFFRELMVLTHLLLGLFAGYLLYKLLSEVNSRWKYPLAIIGSIVIALQLFEWKIFAIFLLAIAYVYLKKPKNGFLYLAVACGPIIYIKLSLGIACMLVLASALLITKTNIKEWLRVIAFGSLSLVVFGLILFRSAPLLYGYLYNGVAVSAGYSAAMGIEPTNWAEVITFLLISAGLIFIASWLALPKKTKWFLIPLLIATFFVWKASVVRQDPYGHVESLPYFVGFVLLLVGVIAVLRSRRMLYVVPAGILSGIAVVLSFYGIYLNGYEPSRITDATKQVITFWQIETCRLAPCKNAQELYLDKELKQQVGTKTVDIYPWKELFVHVNNLNWRPRPSPASYGTYTSQLSNLNADFFASKEAPEYLLWDIRQGILSIDGRHLFFDEPAALKSILENYKLTSKTDTFLVLQKSEKRNVATTQLESEDIQWNKWVEVKADNKLVVANISYKPDIKQKVGATLFRSEPIFIEVEKKSGLKSTYRTVPENLSQGIVINQLPSNTDEMTDFFERKAIEDPVIKFRLVGEDKGEISLN